MQSQGRFLQEAALVLQVDDSCDLKFFDDVVRYDEKARSVVLSELEQHREISRGVHCRQSCALLVLLLLHCGSISSATS